MRGLDEWGGEEDYIHAQGFIEEAYQHAVDLRLSKAVAACRKGPVIDRLLECLNAIPASDFLTPPQVAEQLGTSPETVIGWIKSGQLNAANLATGDRPRYVITPDDLAEFLKSRQPQPPQPRKLKPRTGSYRRFSE